MKMTKHDIVQAQHFGRKKINSELTLKLGVTALNGVHSQKFLFNPINFLKLINLMIRCSKKGPVKPRTSTKTNGFPYFLTKKGKISIILHDNKKIDKKMSVNIFFIKTHL